MYSNLTIIEIDDLIPAVQELMCEVAARNRISEMMASYDGASELKQRILETWFIRQTRELTDVVIVPGPWDRVLRNLPVEFFDSNRELVRTFYERLRYPLHPAINLGFHDPCMPEFQNGCLWLKFMKTFEGVNRKWRS